MSIQNGQSAPEFALYNTEKQEIKVGGQSEYTTVLLFFPMAFTSVCTAELCQTRDNLADYTNLDAKVYGISVDSVFTLAKFKEEQKLTFDLLSDFNKNVSQTYGALYENFVLDMKGVSKRAAFVIDKTGKVAYSQVLESAGDMPDFQALNKVLQDLKSA